MKTTTYSKAATVLAAAAIATTCFVGGTLSRYISTAGDKDATAIRVAKWTFTDDNAYLVLDGLFSQDKDLDLVSLEDEQIIAPTGEGTATISFEELINRAGQGTETGYTISLKATKVSDIDNTNVKYSLTSGGETQSDLTLDELVTAINGVTCTYCFR
jgi:hypothetical protein